MKISLLVLRCEDIEISRDFYEKLGFEFQNEKHGSGPEHYASENEGFVFELYPNKGAAPDDNTRLGFEIFDIQGIISQVEIAEEYKMNDKTTYVVVDPDGRKVELN